MFLLYPRPHDVSTVIYSMLAFAVMPVELIQKHQDIKYASIYRILFLPSNQIQIGSLLSRRRQNLPLSLPELQGQYNLNWIQLESKIGIESIRNKLRSYV